MPDPIDIEQPDGTTFKGKVQGDEFQNWIESTESGHTVVKNRESNNWEYAEKLPDGTLAPSGVKVERGGKYAPSFLPKGVKPNRDTVSEGIQKQRLQRKLQQRLPGYLPSGSSSSDGTSSETLSSSTIYSAAGDYTPVPVSGTKKLLVVLINFANRSLISTPDTWWGAVFDTTPGVKSVVNFYKDNSFGQLTIAPAFTGGTHPGVISVTIADSHPNCGNSFSYTSETTILNHALAQANASVDLSSFDPANDEVYFVYAGYDASGSSKTPNIWAHAWGGSIALGSKTITGWALCGELNNSSIQSSMGTIVHELGHSMGGLPDLYDTTYHNAGMGAFSVMAGGSWGTIPGQPGGSTPVALDAWSREYLGWTAPVVASDGTATLGTALASNTSALKLVHASNTSEYWLAENRQPVGWDAGITGLVSGYAGGLLVSHVDVTVGTLGYNDINSYQSGAHQGVVPEQASTATCNMQTTGCGGSSTTTFYSGNNAIFGPTSTVNSAYYNGSASNFTLQSISTRGTTMTADVKTSASLSVASFSMPAAAKSLTIPISSFVATGSNPITGYRITKTSTPPLATATGWLATAPVSFAATGSLAGPNTFYAWVKDKLGNVSNPATATVNIDLTKPVVTVFTAPTRSNTLSVPVTLNATDDNSGVTGYLITTSSTVPLPTAAGWSATEPTDYTASAAGAKTLYAWAKDAAGNVSLSKSAACVFDLTKPVVSAFTLPLTPVKSLTIPISTFAATDNVKVGYFLITESATAPTIGDTGWSALAPKTFVCSNGTSDGAKTLYAWAMDTSGNISLAKTASVTIDTTPAATSAFTIPALSKSLTIPISSFSASDNGVIVGYAITATNTPPTVWSATKPVSFVVASAGSKTLYAWVKDKAGNVSSPASATVNVDLTKPVVTAFTAPTLSNSLTVAVTVTATDDNSGLTGYLITESSTLPALTATGWSGSAPTSYTASAAGSKILYAWAKDVAGNVSLGKTAACVFDQTKPVVSAFTLPLTPVKSLTIPVSTYTATDNVKVGYFLITESATAPAVGAAGWSAVAPKSYVFANGAADGAKTLYAWAKDTAGNVSLAKTATVTIDTTQASISAFTLPAVSKALLVPISSFSASDNGVIVGYAITTSSTPPTVWTATKPVSFSVASAGSKTLYAWVKDKAGNVSSPASATVNVDLTKPVVSTFTAPPLVSSLTVPVTFTATDDNSGVTGYLITESSTAPALTATGWSGTAPTSYTAALGGTKALYAWTKDAAGNVSLSKWVAVKLIP